MRNGRNVVTAFQLPPNPPLGVVEAAKKFDEIATRWAELAGQLEDAQAGVAAAKAEDTRKAAEAFSAGKPVKDISAGEREALARVAGLKAALVPAEVAVDQAGNDLLGPIAEAREEWLATLTDEQEAASAAYAAAIAKAKAALDKIKKTSGAIGWLERFDAGQARVGRDRGWHGGGRAEVEDELGRKFDPSSLLVMAAKVNEPTAAEQRAANRAAKKAAQKEKVEA